MAIDLVDSVPAVHHLFALDQVIPQVDCLYKMLHILRLIYRLHRHPHYQHFQHYVIERQFDIHLMILDVVQILNESWLCLKLISRIIQIKQSIQLF